MGFRAGEDVFVESKPFSYVVDPVDPEFCKNVCDSCLKEANGLFACTKCHEVYYCSKSCQKNAWESHHEVECGYLQSIPESLKSMSETRHILRIVLKLSQNGKDEFVTLPNGKKRYFADLMSHKDKLEEDAEKMKALKGMFKPFQVWLADKAPSFDEFLEIYGKIKINAVDIEHASGLYLGYSAIDHSCAPNATFFDNGTELTIRAIDDIEDFSDLRFSYIDLDGVGATSEERKKKLKDRYNFDCKCTKCEDPNSDAKLMSLKCKKCSGWVNEKTKICADCNQKIEFNGEEMSIIEKFKNGTLPLPTPAMGTDEVGPLFKKYARIFHPFNKLFGKTFVALFLYTSNFVFEVEQMNDRNANKLLLEMLKIELIHLQEHQPKYSSLIDVIEGQIGQACCNLQLFDEALTHFQRAEEVCKIEGGGSAGKNFLAYIEECKMKAEYSQMSRMVSTMRIF